MRMLYLQEFKRSYSAALLKPQYRKFLDNVTYHATKHRDTIQRFGRFPKRNEALGRKSTLDELRYIQETPNVPY